MEKQPKSQANPPLPPGNQNAYSHLALLLGARPDMPNRKEYLCFLTASVVFILGTLGFLGYIYLELLRRDTSPTAGTLTWATSFSLTFSR